MILCEKLDQAIIMKEQLALRSGASVSNILRSIIRSHGAMPFGELSDYLCCIYSIDDPIGVMGLLDPWCANFGYGMPDEELVRAFDVFLTNRNGKT